MRKALIAFALLSAALTASACQLFSPIQDPASVGCSAEEANECRVAAAALIIKASDATISEALDRNLVTPAEARRLHNLTGAGLTALAQARAALPLTDGSFEQRMAALEAILTQLLAEQLIQNGS